MGFVSRVGGGGRLRGAANPFVVRDARDLTNYGTGAFGAAAAVLHGTSTETNPAPVGGLHGWIEPFVPVPVPEPEAEPIIGRGAFVCFEPDLHGLGEMSWALQDEEILLVLAGVP